MLSTNPTEKSTEEYLLPTNPIERSTDEHLLSTNPTEEYLLLTNSSKTKIMEYVSSTNAREKTTMKASYESIKHQEYVDVRNSEYKQGWTNSNFYSTVDSKEPSKYYQILNKDSKVSTEMYQTFHYYESLSKQSSKNFTTNGHPNDLSMNLIGVIWLTLVICGLLTNTLSFLIIYRQNLLRSLFWVYIASLSITDNLAIICHSFYLFLLRDFMATDDIICKISVSLAYVWSMISYYILCAMSIERAILILRPYKILPGQKHAILVVVIISMALLVTQPSYILLTHGIVNLDISNTTSNASDRSNTHSENLKFCAILPEYQQFQDYIFLLDIALYAIIPIVLILSANIAIVIALIRRARNTTLANASRKVNEDRNITYMLLALSCYFVLSLLPFVIFFSTWQYFYDSYVEAVAHDNGVFKLVMLAAFSNHISNFWLYQASGKLFRQKTILFFKSILATRNSPRVEINMSDTINTQT